MAELRSICVYCGANVGARPDYAEAAEGLGRAIGASGMRLVYGGGAVGLMGILARAAMAAGGPVTGIIPQFLIAKESSGDSLTRLSETIITADMHERKHAMFERADAFIALPGGIGTLEEIVEVMTWAQLGRHTKPICLVNTDGFWNPLLELMGEMGSAGFIHTASKVRPLVLSKTEDVVPAIIRAWQENSADAGDKSMIERL